MAPARIIFPCSGNIRRSFVRFLLHTVAYVRSWRGRRRQPGSGDSEDSALGGKRSKSVRILRAPTRDEVADRLDAIDNANALTRAPNVAPHLGARITPGAEIHFARIAWRQ